MRDDLAQLATLVLPGDATSGQRIVLDGDNGTIIIYNSSDQVVGQISPTGVITVTDPVSGSSVIMSSSNPPAILFHPADFGTHTLGTGSIGADTQTVPDRGRLLVVSPSVDGSDRLQITLENDQGSGANMFVSDTGGGNQAHLKVFGDIEAVTDYLRNGVTMPRGLLSLGIDTTSNVNLSTTAGNFTAIVGNAEDISVFAGRSYRITYWNEGTGGLLVNGSGFATTNAWTVKLQRSTNGGSTWADISGELLIARLEVAAATRKPIPVITTIYQPASDATVRWQLVASKSSGAGTVTSSMDHDHLISIEDIGPT